MVRHLDPQSVQERTDVPDEADHRTEHKQNAQPEREEHCSLHPCSGENQNEKEDNHQTAGKNAGDNEDNRSAEQFGSSKEYD